MVRNLVTLTLVLATLLSVAQAQLLNGAVLYSFTGSPDGANPQSRLTSDGAGDFYGTTNQGGLGYGTVYELSPNGSGFNEAVLYSFTGGTDGAYPASSYVMLSGGNLYGTASQGGEYGYGTVFELSPVGASWVESVLYSFTGGTDGGDPQNGLLMDANGNLYGTNSLGVFELSDSNGNWTEQVIYKVSTSSGLTMGGSGSLFGVGVSNIFEVSPNGKGGWSATVICTLPLTQAAKGTLVFDQTGNLYGTAFHSAARSSETFYRLSPQAGKKTWKKKTLFNFNIDYTGQESGGVVIDEYGNLYGTQGGGGSYNGAVFELSPPVGTGPYTRQLLWNFDGTDGEGPGSVIMVGGVLYGATSGGGIGYTGGSTGDGVVFKVTPP